jgi:hypothetical protein
VTLAERVYDNLVEKHQPGKHDQSTHGRRHPYGDGRQYGPLQDMKSWPDLGEQQFLREASYRDEDERTAKFGDIEWMTMGESPSTKQIMSGTSKQWYSAVGEHREDVYRIKPLPVGENGRSKGWKLTFKRKPIGEFTSLSDAKAAAWDHKKTGPVGKRFSDRVFEIMKLGLPKGGWIPGPNAEYRRVGDPPQGMKRPRYRLGKPMAEELEADTRAGGTTYNVANKSSPIKGMSLSIYPDRTKPFKPESFSHDDLIAYYRENADLIDKNGHYLGTWFDTDTNSIVADVAVVVESHEEATRLCVEHNQDAYWDLWEKKEIRVKKPRGKRKL